MQTEDARGVTWQMADGSINGAARKRFKHAVLRQQRAARIITWWLVECGVWVVRGWQLLSREISIQTDSKLLRNCKQRTDARRTHSSPIALASKGALGVNKPA